MKNKKNPLSNLIEVLNKIESVNSDVVEEGFFTFKEIIKSIKSSKNTTQTKLKKGIANGTIIKKNFRIKCPGGLRVVPHYKLKKAL